MEIAEGNKTVISGQAVNQIILVGCSVINTSNFKKVDGYKFVFLEELPKISSTNKFQSVFISESWVRSNDFPLLTDFLNNYDRYAFYLISDNQDLDILTYSQQNLVEDIIELSVCIPQVLIKLSELAEKKRNYSVQMIEQSHEISLYKRALDQSASAIEITDADGVIVYVNDQFQQSTGYCSKELIGEKPSILSSGRMDKLFFQNLWDTIKAGKEWKGEFENKRKDGSFFYQRATIRPLQRPDGLITHFIAVKNDVVNITQDELSKEFIINAANIATWDWDLTNDKIKYNEQWAGLIGYGHKELGEDTGLWKSLIHKEDKPKVMQLLQDHLEFKTEKYDAIYRLRHKDGHFVWIHDSGKVIATDVNGKPARMAGTHEDVTELRTQIEIVSDQNQQLSESHEMAQMGGWTLNLMTNQAQWSKQLLLILGEDLGLEEHDSDRYIAKIHPEDRAKAIDVFQEAKKTGTSYTQYYRLLLEDEEIKFAEERGWFIFDDEGRAIEARGITKDITQGVNANRLNEIQEQRLSAAAEIAGLGYWELNLASGEVFWSDELFDLFELDQKKDVASWDKYVSLMHPDDISMSPEEFHQALYKGSFKNEHRMLLDSGRIIYLEEVANVEFDEDGHPKIVRGVSHDVTESKLKSIRLEKETIDHRRAQKLAGIGHFKLYYPSGLFEWSVGIYDIIGVEQTDERLTFDEIAKRVSPEDAMRIQNSIEASLTSGERGGVVHRLTRDDNSIRMLDVKWEPFYNELNEPEGILGTCHDITEIWEAQNKLVEAEKIAQMGHWSLDYKSGELFWSDQVYQIFDKEPQEFPATYEAFLGYVHPDDREMVNNAYYQSVENKSDYKIDHRLVVNGQIKHVAEKAITYYDEEGIPLKTLGTVQDITEKVLIEQEAAEVSKRLGMLVDSIPDLIFVYDLEGYFIDYFESTFDQPLVPPESFLGKHYGEILPSPVAKKVDKHLPKSLESGKVERFQYNLTKNNEIKWYEATMSPYRDGQEIIGATVVSRDITKEKLYENQLLETKLNLELILNSLDKLLFIVDHEGTYLEVFYSENGLQPYMPKDEILGKSWREVMPEYIHEKLDYAFKLVDKKKVSTSISYSLDESDNEQFFEASVAPFKDESKGINGYSVLVSDISDQVKAKRLLKKSEEQFKKHSEFLPHILWTRNKEGELTYMNAKGQEYYGDLLNQISHISNDTLSVIHPQDRPHSTKLWNKANKEKTSFQSLERRKDYKGDFKWFSIKVDPIVDRDGKFLSWIGVATDVDKELRIARENESLVNNLQERVKEAECMYAISNLAENLGRNLDEIFEDAINIIPTGFQYPELTKAQITYNDKRYGKNVQYRNKRFHELKVRDQVVGKIVVGVSAKSHKGQLNYFLKEEIRLLEAIADNLSLILTQKLDQLVLAESEKRFKSLFNSASIGIIIEDLPTLQIVDVNHAMSALLHYERSDMVGLTLLDLSPEYQGGLMTSQEKFIEVGHNSSGGFFWQLLDNYGQNIHCAINVNTIDIEGKKYQVSFIRNVSDEMAAYTALENSEELYRNIFDNIQEGYYIRDRSGKIININPEGLKILEASEQQVIDHSAVEFFKHLDGTKITFTTADNEVELNDIKVIAMTPNGKEKYLSINKKLIEFNDAPDIIECSFRDITESVLSDKLQKLSLELFNIENNTAEDILQYTTDELCNIFGNHCGFLHFVDEDEQEVAISIYSKDTPEHLKLDKGAVISLNDNDLWADTLINRKGFNYCKSDFGGNPLERPIQNVMIAPIFEERKIVALLGLGNRSYDFSQMELDLLSLFGRQFYDVFNQKKMKEAILDEKQKFENIVDALPGIVYRLSLPEITLEYVSDHTQDLLGIASYFFVNGSGESSILSLIHPDDKDQVYKTIERAVDDIDTYSLIHRMKKDDGKYVWVSNTGKVSLRADDTYSVEGFIYDVTDRIKNEERMMNAVMEASDKEKSRISKEIHDSLQQTLTIASLNLEFVKKERALLSAKAQDKFQTGWTYLKKSMDDSRSIAHRLMPKAITDFGVVPVLKDMFEELNRSGEIEFEFITNFYDRIKIPAATNVYKVVQEAVNNILKHSEAKTVTVQYLLLDDLIQLSIEDDGLGFDMTKVGKKGSFGLASMKSRATALSAELILDSHPGYGTTLVLEIPYNENIKYYE